MKIGQLEIVSWQRSTHVKIWILNVLEYNTYNLNIAVPDKKWIPAHYHNTNKANYSINELINDSINS